MNRYFHNLLSYFIIILFATNCQVLVSLHEQTECELDELCNHINTNIQSLQRIVSVNNDIDYITEIQPLKTNGQTLGYSIDFEHSNPIIIYSIGKFGCVHIPKISVKRGCDGIWYWMVNGEYLLDELGNCAQTSVVTPKLKIKNNVWFISSNDEKIWFDVGDVLVEQDIVNEYLYISVYQDEDTVSFQLIDGQILIIHKLPKKDSIKILCFGNSFTEDSMSYVPYILQNIAPDLQVTLGIAYIGGSPLAQHCAYLTNETILCNNYTYSVVNSHYFRNEMEVFYTYHKNQYSSIWESKSKISIEQMLLDEEWDIITFQQSGGLSHQDWTDYYEPYISLFNKILFLE